MNWKKLLVISALVCCLQFSAWGGDGQEQGSGYKRFDASIRRFLMGGMDTTYVKLPSTSWEIPVVSKIYGYQSRLTIEDALVPMNTPVMVEIGAGIGYHGLDLVYTHAVGRNRMDFNFEFDFYDNYWGVGINIGRQGFGKEIYGESGVDGADEVVCRAILLDGYYAVFGNKFSYPASIYGNYIQKKSAGSPLVNFWYERRDYWAQTSRAAAMLDKLRKSHFDNFAITACYGYNFSIAEGRAVLTVSAGAGILLPSFGLATEARAGGMIWANEHLRISFAISNFYSKSWNQRDNCLEDNTWRGSVGLFYCFGKG